MIDRNGHDLPEQRLAALGIELPPPLTPAANYLPFVMTGNLLFLAGQVPREADGRRHTGKVGIDVTIEEAYAHARLTGINMISTIRSAVCDLGRVEGIVKVFGMVNAAPDFIDHAKVVNGCSDLLVDVFGARGRHARSAVGQGSLPNNITVEIEAIIAVRQDA
jgi:enamine deaminase RidA (YjgF/YER057c/UK114 family)